MRKLRGFTLLEILVVVTILSLLMVLLFPTFRAVRQAVRRARCLYNLKQITLAMHNFAVVNSNKLPSGSSMPWGAQDPTNSAKVLNASLSGDGYRVLECPDDQASKPGLEYSYFQTKGYSYYYVSGDGQGISAVVGDISWQEEAMGDLPSIDQMLTRYQSATGYWGDGPEEVPDPNARNASGYSLRARDVTRAELDQMWENKVKPALAAMGNRPGGFNIDYEGMRVWKNVNSSDHDPDPPPPAPQNPRFKWRDQFADYRYPIAPGSRDTSKWARVHPWQRPVYNYDYWKKASKKVAVLDYDASFEFAIPASGDAYPKTGQGFWHGYPYVSDPDRSGKWLVRCHAGFLDGHASPILMHRSNSSNYGNNAENYDRYGSIDRDKNEYY